MSDDTTPVVTAAVTPVPLPENFSVPQMMSLARDLVLQMYDRPVILKKHNVTEAQCAYLEANDYFKKIMHELGVEWNSPRTSTERLAVQTAVGLETVLPDAIARISIKNEPLAGVAQMVKVLADIAGANAAAKQKQAPGEKFTININLGGDKETYEKTRPPVITLDAAPGPDAGTDAHMAVQSLAQGAAALLSIQTEPEKA